MQYMHMSATVKTVFKSGSHIHNKANARSECHKTSIHNCSHNISEVGPNV